MFKSGARGFVEGGCVMHHAEAVSVGKIWESLPKSKFAMGLGIGGIGALGYGIGRRRMSSGGKGQGYGGQ